LLYTPYCGSGYEGERRPTLARAATRTRCLAIRQWRMQYLHSLQAISRQYALLLLAMQSRQNTHFAHACRALHFIIADIIPICTTT